MSFIRDRDQVNQPSHARNSLSYSTNLDFLSDFYRILVGFWSDFIRIFRVVDLRHLRRVYWALITPSAVKTPKRFDHLIDYFDINYEK